jgi:predicted deacetylase
MSVFVSLHDVTPALATEIELALRIAREVRIKPALAVVPKYHRSWDLRDYPEFCERLRDLQGQGHAIYLHGLFHEAAQGSSWASFVRQRIMSAGEAEFGELTPQQARDRVREGLGILGAVGLKPEGFVPPAWVMSPWLLPILAEQGLPYTEDHARIYNPVKGTSRASLVLNFASRTPGRLLSSVVLTKAASQVIPWMSCRFAMHPADMRYELLRSETTTLLSLAQNRTVAHGEDLFGP